MSVFDLSPGKQEALDAAELIRQALASALSPIVVVTGCLAALDRDSLTELGQRVVGLGRQGAREELLRRSLLHHPTMPQHHHPVRQRPHHAQIVADEHESQAVPTL